MSNVKEALRRFIESLNIAFNADEDPFGIHHNDATAHKRITYKELTA